MIKEGFGALTEVGNEEQLFSALKKLIWKEYNFDQKAMHEFVLQHASYEAVGKQMNDYYKEVIDTMTNTKG